MFLTVMQVQSKVKTSCDENLAAEKLGLNNIPSDHFLDSAAIGIACTKSLNLIDRCKYSGTFYNTRILKKIGTIFSNVTLNILHMILYNRYDTNVCLAGKWDSNFNSSVVASLDWADFICHYNNVIDRVLCMDFVTDSPVQRNIMTPDVN